MPKIKSAKKALRQNVRHRKTNDARKAALKKVIKEFKKLVAAKKKDEAIVALKNVYKSADKIAKTNLITKNKAARIKSRATKLLDRTFSAK